MAIEFMLRGHRAVLTKVLPRRGRWPWEDGDLVAVVDFPDGVLTGTPWLSTSVALAAREYTREELIKYVTTDIERQLQVEAEERKKRKKAEEDKARLNDLADKVNKVVQ